MENKVTQELAKFRQLKVYREVWEYWQNEDSDYNFGEWLYNKAYPEETKTSLHEDRAL